VPARSDADEFIGRQQGGVRPAGEIRAGVVRVSVAVVGLSEVANVMLLPAVSAYAVRAVRITRSAAVSGVA